jgi:hypothetical protein
LEAGIGENAAHREMLGGEGLDGHLREYRAWRSSGPSWASFRSAAAAIAVAAVSRSVAGMAGSSKPEKATRSAGVAHQWEDIDLEGPPGLRWRSAKRVSPTAR